MNSTSPNLTPEALRVVVKMRNILARDGIQIGINEPDIHLRLIEIAEKFSDPELRACGLKLKEELIYSKRQAQTIRRMQEILATDGIDIDISAHDAVERLIRYSEHFQDKELKKLGRTLKAEQQI